MKTMKFKHTLNNGAIGRINFLEDGTYEAVTTSTTKIYKSLAWAKKYLASYGYYDEITEVEEEVVEAEAGNEYVASCEDAEGNIVILEKTYSTKKAFKEDIKGNGYELRYGYIFTKEEYEKFINEDADFMLWFEDRLNRRSRRKGASAPAVEEVAVEEAEGIGTVMGFLIQEKVSKVTVKEHEQRYKAVIDSMAGNEQAEQVRAMFEDLIAKLKAKAGKWCGHFGKHKYKDAKKLLNELREATPTNEYRLLKCMIKYDKKTGFVLIGQEPEAFKILED